MMKRNSRGRRSLRARCAGLAVVVASLAAAVASLQSAEYFVGLEGDDNNAGTRERPWATPAHARDAVRASGQAGREPVTIYLRAGTYYLAETLVFTPEDSGTEQAPVVYQSVPGEEAVLSGGVKLDLKWESHKDGIRKARVPSDLTFDQLFVNGERQPMARYPNFDPQVRHFNGYAADAFSPSRAARWADPRGGVIHAMHAHQWGDFHYVITGKDAGHQVSYEGGWQNNRRLGMHGTYRMVENIFEELDAPGEWFHDAKTATLFYFPAPGVDLDQATVAGVRLRHLVEFRGRGTAGSANSARGSGKGAVRFLRLKGLIFRHAARTFMDNKEPLLRSDWTTYRGGAVFFNGAEDCTLEDCFLDQLGGNAVFVNNYNRRIAIRGCHIARAGANGVAFVGDPQAVRNALLEYNERQSFDQIDLTPGPKSPNYPADCLVEDCLIHLSGRVEKQTAPVQIAMARNITVRHCSIYDVPRAGINIGDGCWGGHVIEFCDVFDTVKETGDHGSFNSWGRDRYWGLKGVDPNTITLGDHKELPLLDVVQPIVLRNNRWRCDHGWDIDLDDGSSNYEIRNNLCLNGGIKLREGFYRVCENNIMVNNSFHPHVWYGNSQDVFRRNIVFAGYRPIRANPPWGKECDFNLLHRPGQPTSTPARGLKQQSGWDAHSVEADAMFLDPAQGDYRVRDGSPALELGFQNFPMNQFGVRKPELKAIARTPVLPPVKPEPLRATVSEQRIRWKGAMLKDLSGEEYSAVGVARDANGVLVVDVPADSDAARAGLRNNDFIQAVGGKPVRNVADFLKALRAVPPQEKVRLEIIRHQRRETLQVEGGSEVRGRPSEAKTQGIQTSVTLTE